MIRKSVDTIGTQCIDSSRTRFIKAEHTQNFMHFINNIDNQYLKEIINLSFDTYKTILINCN